MTAPVTHTEGVLPLPILHAHPREITDSEGFRGFESPVGGKGCPSRSLLTNLLTRNTHNVKGYPPLLAPPV